MIRTLPNGQTDFEPVTHENYERARETMGAVIAAAKGAGIEADQLANACLAFIAGSLATGKVSAYAVAITISELTGIVGDVLAAAAPARRSLAAFAVAAAADNDLSDDGLATLASAVADKRFDPSCWATLTTIADDLVHRRCRGVVPCPSCQAERCRGHIADASASAEAKSN